MAHDPDEFSRTNSVTGYIDGVPFKISKKFRPPRNVTLPVSFQHHCSVNLLLEEYPFQLEHNVLDWTQAQQRTKEAQNQAKAEQVASEIERFSQQPTEISLDAKEVKNLGESETIPGPLIEKEVNIPRPLMASMGNSILTPVLLSQQKHKPVDMSSEKLHNFNLADFESDTSSPFDNMELKTLNDIEELKSVLESVSTSCVPNNHQRNTNCEKNRQEQSKKAPLSTFAQDSTNNNNLLIYNQQPFNFPQIEARLNGPTSFSTCAEFHKLQNHSSNGRRTSLNNPSTALPPLKLTQTLGNSTTVSIKQSTPPAHIHPHLLEDAISWNPNLIKSDSDISLRTNVYSKHYSSELDKLNAELDIIIGSQKPFSYSSLPYLKRNAKSTPDISQEDLYTPLVVETRRKICHSPPPRPSSDNFKFLQKWNPYSPLPPLPGIKNISRDRPSSLTDPYSQLSQECQKFVNHVTDMGFPRPRVARAVQRLGIDDKQVIEHLCLVESFGEKGYNVDQAESALLLLDDNEDKVKQYLDLMCQFLDLGFKEEAIRKALILHNNDRDKVLDYLVL